VLGKCEEVPHSTSSRHFRRTLRLPARYSPEYLTAPVRGASQRYPVSSSGRRTITLAGRIFTKNISTALARRASQRHPVSSSGRRTITLAGRIFTKNISTALARGASQRHPVSSSGRNNGWLNIHKEIHIDACARKMRRDSAQHQFAALPTNPTSAGQIFTRISHGLTTPVRGAFPTISRAEYSQRNSHGISQHRTVALPNDRQNIHKEIHKEFHGPKSWRSRRRLAEYSQRNSHRISQHRTVALPNDRQNIYKEIHKEFHSPVQLAVLPAEFVCCSESTASVVGLP
jgi:hypothetical protein